jgi:hypothetical protein
LPGGEISLDERRMLGMDQMLDCDARDDLETFHGSLESRGYFIYL